LASLCKSRLVMMLPSSAIVSAFLQQKWISRRA
jgi:hypothetical protein